MTEPNKENIAKWVEALRSGDYVQGTGVLRAPLLDEDNLPTDVIGMCCLGVACDISGLGEWRKNRNGASHYEFGDTREEAILPTSVRSWLGVPEHNPSLTFVDSTGDERQRAASHLNDALHLTFEEIADAIERTYLT